MSSSLFSRLKSKLFPSFSPSRRRQDRRRARRAFFEPLESRHLLASLDHFVTTEHTDLASAYSPGSGWSLHVHEDIQGALETDEALLYVGNNAAIARPSASTWAFTGVAAGETFYVAPQTLTPGRMYLGASAYGVATSSVVTTNPSVESKGRQSGNSKWVKYAVVDVEHTNADGTLGDGVFSMWFTGTFGTPTVLASTYNDGASNPNGSGFDATDGLTADDHWWLLANGHAHYNFGFSEPGRYEVQLQLSANFTSGGVVTSDPFTLYFSVGSVGQVEFDSDSYTVAEDGESATINVRRVGGSDGQIEVNYAATGGTATGGEDFELAGGTLVFADGETQKQIVIPILSDDDVEEDETILLNLSAPRPDTIEGFLNDWEASSLLGANDAALLTILDDDNASPEFIAGLTRGHADIGIAFEEGEFDLHVHVHGEEHEGEEEEEHAGLEYAPREILIQIGAASETIATSDPLYSFLGALGGSTIYVLGAEEHPDLPFLGLATEEIADGIFLDDEIILKLKGVSGPGYFSLWSEDSGGVPTAHMATSDGVSAGDFLALPTGVHAHFNMAFTAAGNYAVTFEVFATLADGVTEVSSGNVTYYFSVNQGLPPSLTLTETELSYTEQAAARIVDGTASVTDADSANFDGGKLRVDIPLGAHAEDTLSILHQGNGVNQIGVSGNTVTIGISGGGTVILGTFTGGTGGEPLVVELTAEANASRVTRLLRRIAFQNLSDDPTNEERAVRFVAFDGDGEISDAAVRHIVVIPVNDAPIVTTSAGNSSYVEHAPAILIDSEVTVSDADSADFDGGKLTVSISANKQSADRLAILPEGSGEGEINLLGTTVLYGGIEIGAFSGGFTSNAPLVVTLNAHATPEAVQQLARRVAFHNASGNATSLVRTIRYVVNDGDGKSSLSAAKSIAVTIENDAPIVTNPGADVIYKEKAVPVLVAGSATLVDPDSPNFDGGVLKVSLTSGATAADVLSIRSQGAGNGRINLVGANVTYEVGGAPVVIGTVSGGNGGSPLVVTLNGNATLAATGALIRNVTFQVTGSTPDSSRTVRLELTDGDGGASGPVDRMISVVAVNDAPVVTTSAGATSYLENAPAAIIDASIAISDVDSPDFAGGNLTVAITVNKQSTDRLSIVPQGNGVGEINLSEADVLYEGVVIGAYTGGFTSSGTLTITFNTNATIEAVEALARRIAFHNAGDNPTDLTRTIRFLVNDGDGKNSLAATKEIHVSVDNDSPIVTNPGANVAYKEDAAPALVAGSATLVDPDSANFDGGVLTVNLTSGATADVLSIRSQGVGNGRINLDGANVTYEVGGAPVVIGTVSGGNGGSPLVVTLNDQATLAATRALIRNVTFQVIGSTHDSSRTISIELTDGDGGSSGAVDRTINVVAVNDAPVVTTSAGETTYMAQSAPVVIDNSVTVSDMDSPDFAAGFLTVTIGSGKQSTDRLTILAEGNGAGQINVSGTDVLYEGVVIGTYTGGFTSSNPLKITFNANATLAAVQKLARRIAFHNTSAAPSAAARVISFVVNDGDGKSSLAATKTVTIV